ncbi:MAG: hypothetical protein OHK0056_26640 [Bacteriovoracaceae bacterium]
MKNKFWAILLTLLFIVSCADKEGKVHPELKELGITASKVTPLPSELMTTGEWAGLADFKNSNLMGFQTCLKDPLLNPLYQEEITIRTPIKDHLIVTDSNGCFQWNELFEFNPLLSEHFFDYEVSIINTKKNAHMLTIPLMVNPWRTTTNFKDLRYDTRPMDLEKNEDYFEMPFRITNASFQQTSKVKGDKGQSYLPSLLEFSIQYEKLNEKGEKYVTKLNQATIELEYQLVQNSNNVIAQNRATVTSRNGTFSIAKDLKLLKSVDGNGSFEVIFTITFPIRHLSRISSKIPFSSIQGGSVQVADVVSGDNESTHIVTTEAIESESPQGFLISQVTARPGQISQVTYNKDSKRRQKTRLNICLADSFSNGRSRPLMNFEFDVESNVGIIENKEASTKESGCAEVDLQLEFDLWSCEKFLPITLTVYGKKEWAGQKVERKIEINPWNREDYFYDNDRQGKAPNLECIKPIFNIDRLEYSNLGLKRDQLFVNKFLELKITRDFMLKFNPTVLPRLSTQTVRAASAMTFGEIEVEAYIYAPIGNEIINYVQPNPQNLMLLSKSQGQFTINHNGEVMAPLSFGFDIADTHLLSNKNLLLLKVKSQQFSNVEEASFVIPFVASQNASQSVTMIDQDILKHLNKAPIAAPKIEQNPLEVYIDHLKSINDDKEIVTFHDLQKLNEERPINSDGWQLGRGMSKDRYYSELTFEEVRMLTRDNGKMPKQTLLKLCRHFYEIPGLKRELHSLGRISTTQDGGEKFTKCINEPRKYISLLGMTFVDKLIRENNGLAKAKFIADNNGRLNRGKGYFAGSGDRSGVDQTTSETSSWMVAMGGEFGLPSPFNFGMEGGYAKTYAVSDSRSVGSSQMAMVRYGSNQDDLNINYESLTLEVIAETKECFTASAEKSDRVLIFCMPENRLQKLEETWYFLEESNRTNNGILADGTRLGGDYMAQVIRGKENFNRIWDRFVHNDNAMIVQNLDQLDIYEAFRPPLKDNVAEYLFEKSKDNAIPGAVIKTVRNPHSNNFGISR